MPHQPISDDQRKALRLWFHQQRPRPTQVEATKWFYRQYNRKITQSTVSESLSERFKYVETAAAGSSSFRKRQAQWPLLEIILFDWQQRLQRRGLDPTGEILCTKASEIWPHIPEYASQKAPNFSRGWLEGFKKRHKIKSHKIKSHKRHGEAAWVPANVEAEMRSIQTLCGEYKEEDIFNMDETGLFWRMAPSSGLATEARPGAKKDKTRISVVCCTNFTGTEKHPLWLIGRSKQPRPLKRINLKALGVEWRASQKSWMTSLIMAEWLQAFYEKIGSSRKVLLLMDNFSAHIAGVEMAPPPLNIRIQWLPPNATSLYQPLDQGIIQNLKVHYRKSWLEFMFQEYEKDQNPLDKINLLNAVRWLRKAWFSSVQALTIYRCFRKAKIQPQEESLLLPDDPAPNLTSLYQTVQMAGHIQEVMSLENFLNPLGENESPYGVEEEAQGVDIEDIIQHHTGMGLAGTEVAEEDDEYIEPPPSASEALAAVEILQRFYESFELSTPSDIRLLESSERAIKLKISASLQQSTP